MRPASALRRGLGDRMIIGRILGWLLILLALVLLAAQAWAAWQGGVWLAKPLGALWYEWSRGSLNLTQAIVQRHLHPAIWDNGFLPVLELPAWLVFAVLGLVLAFLFRRRIVKRKRWYGSR